MDYSNMSKEELVNLLKTKQVDKARVYMSRSGKDVICVSPPGRMFPVSASRESWRYILAVKDQIEALI